MSDGIEIGLDYFTEQVRKELTEEYKSTIARLKKKGDIEAVQKLLLLVASHSVKYAQAKTDEEEELQLKILKSLRNALQAYGVIAAHSATKMVLSAIGKAAAIMAIAAARVII